MKDKKERNLESPPELSHILSTIFAYRSSMALLMACELDVFNRLSKGTATSLQLAEERGVQPRAMEVLLNACVAIGLLENRQDLFHNLPVADTYLVEGKETYLGNQCKLQFDMYCKSSNLLQTMYVKKDGHGSQDTGWQSLAFHEAAAILGEAMPDLVDLTGRQKLLGVGARFPTYLLKLLPNNPQLKAIVLIDSPAVQEMAKEKLGRAGLADRIEFRQGDPLLADFGQENDVIWLESVLQAYAPEKSLRVLKKTHDSLAGRGMVILGGYTVDESRANPRAAALWSLGMLIRRPTEGQAYSTEEYAQWLKQTGFVNTEVRKQPPPRPFWMVVAERP